MYYIILNSTSNLSYIFFIHTYFFTSTKMCKIYTAFSLQILVIHYWIHLTMFTLKDLCVYLVMIHTDSEWLIFSFSFLFHQSLWYHRFIVITEIFIPPELSWCHRSVVTASWEYIVILKTSYSHRFLTTHEIESPTRNQPSV